MPKLLAPTSLVPLVCFSLLAASPAQAGGGPMNVLVLFSADDEQATAVAQHYQQVRSLPKGHLCGLPGLSPELTSIDVATYQSKIQAPLDACLAALPHPDAIDSLVLVRGLPYLVELPVFTASLQAVLQVHHTTPVAGGDELAGQGQPKGNQASVPNPLYPKGFGVPSDYMIVNPSGAWYSASSTILRAAQQPPSFHRAKVPDAGGYHFQNNLFIVSALDGFDYGDAMALVDRGAASDGTFPFGELLCMRGEDEARQARDPECELVTRMLSEAGLNGKMVDPFDASLAGHSVAAYFTGSSESVRGAIAGNVFVPGAIADNLTSFGAAVPNFFCNEDGTICPENEVQTSVARFVRAGATGAHGTVNEPLNNVFPNAGVYLHYTFGYSLGESWLFNQRFLYWQNIYLGDPLATPYATRPKVAIEGGVETHLAGRALVIHASHDAGIASLELYLEGAKVASEPGDTLTYDPGAKVGDTLDILAVAVARNSPATRNGWPKKYHKPQPDVQGWVSAKVAVIEEMSPSGAGGGGGAGGGTTSGAGGGDPGESGCGCKVSPAEGGLGPWMGLWLGALGLLRTRSRSGRARR